MARGLVPGISFFGADRLHRARVQHRRRRGGEVGQQVVPAGRLLGFVQQNLRSAHGRHYLSPTAATTGQRGRLLA